MTLKIAKITRSTKDSTSPFDVITKTQSSCYGRDLNNDTFHQHVVGYDTANATFIIGPSNYSTVYYPQDYPTVKAPNRLIVTTSIYTAKAYLCGCEFVSATRRVISLIFNGGGYADDSATTFALPAADYGYIADSAQFFMYNLRYYAFIIADGDGSNYKWHIYTCDRQSAGVITQRFKSAALTGATPSIPVGYTVGTNCYVLLQGNGTMPFFTIDFTGTAALSATWTLTNAATTLANTSLYKYGSFWYTSLTVSAVRTYCQINATTVTSIYAGHLDTPPFDDLVRYGSGLGRDLTNKRIVYLTTLYPGVHPLELVIAADTLATVYFYSTVLAIKTGTQSLALYTLTYPAASFRTLFISSGICKVDFLEAFAHFYGKTILLYSDTTLYARLDCIREEQSNGFPCIVCRNYESEMNDLNIPATYSASSVTTIFTAQLAKALYTYVQQIDAGTSINFVVKQGYNLNRQVEDMKVIQKGVGYVNKDGGFCFRVASYQSTGVTLSAANQNFKPNLQGKLISNYGRIRVYGALTGDKRLISEVTNSRADISMTLEFEYPTINSQTELNTITASILDNQITGYSELTVQTYGITRLIKGYTILINLTGYTTQFGIPIDVDQLYYIASAEFNAITMQNRLRLISGTGFREEEALADLRSQQQVEIVANRVTILETPSRFRATLLTTFTTTNGSIVKIPYSTESYDRNSEYDHVTNFRFTTKVAGDYRYSAGFQCDTVAWTAGQAGVIFLYKNNAEYSRGYRVTAETNGSYSYIFLISDTITLAIGDYVDIRFYHNQGSNFNIVSSTHNYFSMELIK